MPDDFTPLSQVAEQGGDDFTPLSAVQSETPQKTSEPQKQSEGGLWDAIKAGILPTIGSIGGGMTLGAISSPTIAGVPAGVLAGEISGGALGEKANQWLGITKPSTGAVVASGLSAPIGRAVFPLAKGAIGMIPKLFGGRELMSEAAENILKRWLSPNVSSKELFDQAAHLKMFVPAAKTTEVIDNVLTKEAERAPTSIRQEIIDVVKPLRDYFIQTGGDLKAISAPEMMEESQRLRLLASKAYDSGNTKLANTINSLRGAMLDDMESAGAGVVRDAAKAYRKEMALEDLGKLLGKPYPVQKIADFMKDNPLFKGAFSDQEKAQINRIATKIASVVPTGGRGLLGRAVTGGAGAAAAGPIGAAAGAIGPDAIRALLATPWGRNVTERILAGSSKMDSATMAALATFARGMMGKPPEQQAEY